MTAESLQQPVGGDEHDPEHDPDPRPVFDGDWAKATGHERQAHMTRVAAWKARHPELAGQAGRGAKGGAQSRMAAGSAQPVTPPGGHAASSQAPSATRAVLEAIRDDPDALDSDRIRAAQQLIGLDRSVAEGAGGAGSELVALREALDLLAPHERLAWLLAERQGA